MKSKLGIMQGRLLQPPQTISKSFPKNNWMEEIEQMRRMGLTKIEWIIDEFNFFNNPLISPKSQDETFSFLKKNKVSVVSIILNCFVLKSFINTNKLIMKKNIKDVIDLITIIENTGIKLIVIPFTKESKIDLLKNLSLFKEAMFEINSVAKSKHVTIALELEKTTYEIGIISEVIFEFSSIGFTFDMGNSISLKNDFRKEFEIYNNRLWHIHIKDRDFSGNRLPLGTGKVDFNSISKELTRIDYDGYLIIEGAWQGNRKPELVIREYVDFCKVWGWV